MTEPTDTSFQSLLHEVRVIPPPAEFSAQAHIRTPEDYDALYRRSVENPEEFWGAAAADLHWFQPWEKVLEWKEPWAKWFAGGTMNLAYNCLDLQVERGRGGKTAILWEGEPGEVRRLTYQELLDQVQRFANVLRGAGVRKGDCVAVYMGMVPELAIAILACARIGAVHSVIFGGFAANALVDRIQDAKAVAVITQDAAWRRGNQVPLKATVDEALNKCASVQTCIVLRRTGAEVTMRPDRDRWWHEEMERAAAECTAEPLDAEHPLYILYTSGTTGKPKGIVHTTGGYAVHTYLTAKLVFDLKEDDIYWCTADIGWVTGHSYVVYGILQNGVTTVMYEGAPNFPENDRFWKIIDDHRVTVFYTAPTAIRAFIKWGDEFPRRHRLDSLRLLGSVGEPINPQTWMWYAEVIGKNRCPIVDTWWQTETGGILITTIPGALPSKPGSAGKPFLGIVPDVVRLDGTPVSEGNGGLLILRQPWPGMARTIFNDPERYVQQYWSAIPGAYCTGDGARRDADGYYWLMGRVDDVINVSGHRLGTMEIESALVAHPKVAEAAVVGRPDTLKGQAIAAFVTLESQHKPSHGLKEELRAWVASEIGALARPDDLRFTDSLPKTRSGKIMRRLLRELAETGEVKGDTTTLEDLGVIAKLREDEE